MNLICRVLILSVCVFTACALPSFGSLKELESKLMHSFAANSTANSTANNTQNSSYSLLHSIELGWFNKTDNNTGSNPGNNTGSNPGNNTANSTQNICVVEYSTKLDLINAETVKKSQECYASGKKVLASMDESLNQTISTVNIQSIILQRRLASCSAQNSSEAIFNCYVATFDANLENLYSITVQSQVAGAALSGYELEAEIVTQACVGAALIENKSDSVIAANELQVCLLNESYKGSQSGNKPKIDFLN